MINAVFKTPGTEEKGPPWQRRAVRTKGVHIDFFEGGNPNGIPLILLHGFPDCPQSWREVASLLNLSATRLVVPFLRGYGGTIVEDNSLLTGEFAALAQDLLNLMDALGLHKAHIAGHDWGARTAYGASVLAPDRILSLTALASPYVAWRGGPLPPAQVRGYWYQLFFQLAAGEVMLTEHADAFCRELWSVWSPNYRFADSTFLEAAQSWQNAQFVRIVLNYYRIRWQTAIGQPAYAVAQQRLTAKPTPLISIPTIFVQGDADACDIVHGADGQEHAFPHSYERVVLEDVGHFPHRENALAWQLAYKSRSPGQDTLQSEACV